MAASGCREASRLPQPDAAHAPLTFTKHIAPIVFRNCAPCHRPGESAPFNLLTYRDVREHARVIVAATGRRFMPPWLPAQGFAKFAGERRLTGDEIDTIRQWVDQGALEGDAADLPSAPQFTGGWRLGEPALVVKLPQPYTMAGDASERWRNFVIPVAITAERFVKTVELRPGTARVVHHALMGVDSTRASRRRDEQDTEPGFPGMDMGDAQAPDGHLLGWTPGMAPFPGVEGQAWRLEPGTDLILQLHLRPSGKAETVDPRVGLYFTDSPPNGPPMHLLRLDADYALDIPPGQKDFVVTDAFELPVDVKLLAVYPHAHFLGRTMEAVARLPDNTEKWLIRIDDWDFNWQDVYRYAEPIVLPRRTTIRMRYSYDNSSENKRNPSHPPRRVLAGLRSIDEMAHLQLQIMTASTGDLLVLKEAFYRHVLESHPDDAWVYYELGNVLRDKGQRSAAVQEYRAGLARDPVHAPTRNNLGILLQEQGALDEAIAQYVQALRAEPDFANAQYNLANALRLIGKFDEAAVHYRDALRLEPDFAEAHNNLGEIFSAQGRLKEAIAEFRAAVRLEPHSAEAHNNLGAALGSAGLFDEAVGHLRQALAIDPRHARARNNLELVLEKATTR